MNELKGVGGDLAFVEGDSDKELPVKVTNESKGEAAGVFGEVRAGYVDCILFGESAKVNEGEVSEDFLHMIGGLG